MITSYSLGYEIEYINNQWIYSDTKESIDKLRSCKYCGKYPTKKGYDSCLEYLPNVKSACCNHGLGKPWVVLSDGTYMEFDDVEQLKKCLKTREE